jgi:predicted nuclease of predicted toxin-antitoxin system
MNIIADENIEHTLIEKLKEHFHVISIYESHRGISDEEIIELAITHNAIVLTEDKDFGELVFIHNHTRISVILLRYTFHERSDLHEILTHLLKHKSSELTGKFTTVTTKKIRTRNL